MPRYKLTIAYDGTNFCGWQKQEPLDSCAGPEGEPPGIPPYSAQTPLIPSAREGRVALRTVQGVVEQAVRGVCREPVEVLGASRTDSGVHARGQVAAFTSHVADQGVGWPADRGVDRLMAALNSRLPDDVHVISAAEVPADFDPIAGAVSKSYSYTFWVGRQRPLWERAYVTHVQGPRVDAAAMQAAAAALVGEHDFAAFAAAGHGRLSTVRTIHSLSVQAAPAEMAFGWAPVGATGIHAAGPRSVCGPDAPQLIRIDIAGSGFLWNMVRIVAGTLLQVGLGQRTPADVAAALASKDRAKAGPTARPEGLCLEWIKYA